MKMVQCKIDKFKEMENNITMQRTITVRLTRIDANTDILDQAKKLLKTMEASQNNEENAKNLKELGTLRCEVHSKYLKSIEYFKKSANQGNRLAENKLGCLYGPKYNESCGFEQNWDVGISWLEKSANQCDANAEYEMGLLFGTNYQKGFSFDQNFTVSMMWLTRSCKHGSILANIALGFLILFLTSAMSFSIFVILSLKLFTSLLLICVLCDSGGLANILERFDWLKTFNLNIVHAGMPL
jgi:hypothetical protein